MNAKLRTWVMTPAVRIASVLCVAAAVLLFAWSAVRANDSQRSSDRAQTDIAKQQASEAAYVKCLSAWANTFNII